MANKRIVKIANKVIIGGNNKVIIQSMTNIKTSKVEDVIKQINELAYAGCDLVRVSVMDEQDAIALKEITKRVDVPIVGDIHFDYKLAILAVKNGASKIRINPGNIGGKENTLKVIEECKKHHVPIRIGVNSGSIEKEFLKDYKDTPIAKANAVLESIKKYVKIFEEANFYDIVLSVKSTDIETTLLANRLLDKTFDYPIHIGLTEAGTYKSGVVKSSYVLTTLLKENIGDTIRVSLTTDPVLEIPICKEILALVGKYSKPNLIACPTCGRTSYKMFDVIKEIEPFLDSLNKKITVAIMGCVVNGPGEAKKADIGIAGGKDCGVLFKKGEIIRKLKTSEMVDVLKEEILKMIE